uniref:Uncharacterized protein n=1 Tax=Pediastrum duplex TaxID=3105 RepID=A0A2U8GIT9_PEDDU|nr:hypothetical protein [Pediastrum duplex]
MLRRRDSAMLKRKKPKGRCKDAFLFIRFTRSEGFAKGVKSLRFTSSALVLRLQFFGEAEAEEPSQRASASASPKKSRANVQARRLRQRRAEPTRLNYEEAQPKQRKLSRSTKVKKK